uniref:TFIIS N-terminal domain-containing protein n=1 Tax=Romanomermis culicivorax TaxID=13658 RepID=A0A915INM1_ROMCU
MQAPPSTIEQLKSRLIDCLDEESDDANSSKLRNLLEEIESTSVTKEALESTRLGLLINDIRKKYQQISPDLSKKCRNIIKLWQKLLLAGGNVSGLGVDGGSATSSPASVIGGASCGQSVTPKTLFSKLSSATATTERVASSPGFLQYDRSLTPKNQYSKNAVIINGHRRLNNLSPSLAADDLNVPGLVAWKKTKKVEEKSVQSTKANDFSATTPTPVSLKIRIKMTAGGPSGTEQQVSIVKSVSVPNFGPESENKTTTTLKNGSHDNTVIQNRENLIPLEEKDVTKNNEETSLNELSGSSITAAVAALPTKKIRQKRVNLDQTPADSADPLVMISKGLPLPKLKSTADLVAEMASAYPEDMARSLTIAASSVASSTIVGSGAGVTSFADQSDFKTQQDYLHISKSELVAQYLKSTVYEGESAVVSPPINNTEFLEDETLKKRTKYLKKQKVDEKSLDVSTPQKKKADWYSILPDLNDLQVRKSADQKLSFLDNPKCERFDDYCLYPAADNNILNLHSRILVTFDKKDVKIENFPKTDSSSEKCAKSEPIIALPYVDVGLPDFLDYNFPLDRRHFAHWSER